MEAIKFIEFYAMEVVVVGAVALTVLAGLYQLIRDQVRASRATPTQAREVHA